MIKFSNLRRKLVCVSSRYVVHCLIMIFKILKILVDGKLQNIEMSIYKFNNKNCKTKMIEILYLVWKISLLHLISHNSLHFFRVKKLN